LVIIQLLVLLSDCSSLLHSKLLLLVLVGGLLGVQGQVLVQIKITGFLLACNLAD